MSKGIGCCPPDSIGPVPFQSKEVNGKVIELTESSVNSKKLKPLPAYVVGKERGAKRVVVIFSDVFGVDSGNHKSFCDELALKLGDNETIVIMPDLFRGCPILGSWGLPHWLTIFLSIPSFIWESYTRITYKAVERDIEKLLHPFLKGVMAEDAAIVCAGFCFGGWVVGRCLALHGSKEEEGIFFQAGVALHPSWQPELFASGDEMKLTERVGTKPILILAANNDEPLHPDGPIVQKLAEQREVESETVSVVFKDQIHGFVSRGSTDDEAVAKDMVKAINLTVSFLREHS